MEALFWVLLGALPSGILVLLEWRKRSILQERLSRLGQLEEELQVARAHRQLLSEQAARLDMELLKERELSVEKVRLLQESEERLREAFRSLSHEALRVNNESFLQLAKTSLERFQEGARSDFERRSLSVEQTVKPIAESLKSFEAKMEAVDRGRAEGQSAVTAHIATLLSLQQELKSETTKLATALKATSVRGRWGELQLRRVVELAGMLEHCDFATQASVSGDEGLRRPDLLVRLPGDRTIVVDAKVPLDAYLEASEVSEEERRGQLLQRHAEHLRGHIRHLASKEYSALFASSAEFVILFVPGEMILHAALAQDSSLIELGAQKGVLLAAPTTLISLLKAASLGWRQEKLSQNAEQISDLGRDLYKRLAVLAQHWTRVGKNLEGAVRSYNEAVGSLERRVLVAARKFEELGAAKGDSTLETVEPIDLLPRSLPSQ